MKHIKLTLFALLVFLSTQAVARKKQHKIVFQFTNAQDSLQQKAFTNQLKNLTKHWPDASIEVVLYNQGLEYVMPGKSKHIGTIQELSAKGVRFVVCQNTMTQRNIKQEELIPQINIVPAGIAEVVEKQEMGWSYIKGGF